MCKAVSLFHTQSLAPRKAEGVSCAEPLLPPEQGFSRLSAQHMLTFVSDEQSAAADGSGARCGRMLREPVFPADIPRLTSLISLILEPPFPIRDPH